MIRVPSAIRTGLFVCLWGLQTACESTLTNDVFSADVAYLDAVPRRAVLHLAGAPTVETSVQTAGLETATRALGPNPAELWRLTREITWQIDHQIFGVLSEVEAVVEAPPTERGDARRIWGPYREALSPVEVRLVVSRRLPGHFEYAYEQRPPGGEYVAPVRGTWAPSRGLFGSGTVLFDFAAAGGAGRVEVDFERQAGGVDFVLDLEGLADETTGEAADAHYEARRDENGAGELAFTWQSGEGDAEVWQGLSRWRADGAGRADVIVSSAGGEAAIVECWDDHFERVYVRGPEGTVGDPARCVFGDVEG
jgi:hypothetical protein